MPSHNNDNDTDTDNDTDDDDDDDEDDDDDDDVDLLVVTTGLIPTVIMWDFFQNTLFTFVYFSATFSGNDDDFSLCA